MNGAVFIESLVEDAALAWLEELGWAIKHGPEIAPGELFAERESFDQVVLERRQCDALLPRLLAGDLPMPEAES